MDLALEDEVVQFITLVGVEELGGIEVYHLEGSLPASDAIFPTTDLSVFEDAPDAPFYLEMWIGMEDALLRRLASGYQYTDELTGQSVAAYAVLTYSDYGKSVDIQPPEVEEQGSTFWTGEDDHGEDEVSATRIVVGEAVEGTIGDIFDYDYFAFQAEEGQTYRIDVALGTLTDSAVILYSYGSQEAWNDDYDDTLASRITWTAPDSGEVFVVVEGFDVGTGDSYTLTITHVTTQP